MKVKPEYLSIGELFNAGNVFHTPKYQRGYSWTEEQINQFCGDIEAALKLQREGKNCQHFFGGIVCAQEEGVGLRKIDNLLVDGQQRLTSFALFVSALLEFIETVECDEEARIDLNIIADELKKRYIEYNERVNREVQKHRRITIGKADDEFFAALLDGRPINPTRDSHNLMLSAKKRFSSFLKESLWSSDVSTLIGNVVDLTRLMDESFLLIHIVTNSRDDAYKLFMVLNDRGINLTEGELLKAHSIGCLDEINDKHEINEVESCWDDILADDPDNVSSFLRWIIAMWEGEHVPNTALLERYKSSLFKSDYAREQIVDNVRFIKECFSRLRLLADGVWPLEETHRTTNWHKSKLDLIVKRLKHTHAMPVLLAASYCGESTLLAVVSEISKFFIRYKVVCGGHAGIFSSLYPKLSHDMYRYKGDYDISDLYNRLQKTLEDKADDTFFEASIRGLQYKRKGDNKPIKYLLVAVEENWNWISSGAKGGIKRRQKLEDKSRVFDYNTTTLEHLYPYSARPEDIDEECEPIKNSIGNLVLLDQVKNQRHDNKSFIEKKDSFVETSVATHSLLVGKRDWKKDDIENLLDDYIRWSKLIFRFK